MSVNVLKVCFLQGCVLQMFGLWSPDLACFDVKKNLRPTGLPRDTAGGLEPVNVARILTDTILAEKDAKG